MEGNYSEENDILLPKEGGGMLGRQHQNDPHLHLHLYLPLQEDSSFSLITPQPHWPPPSWHLDFYHLLHLAHASLKTGSFSSVALSSNDAFSDASLAAHPSGLSRLFSILSPCFSHSQHSPEPTMTLLMFIYPRGFYFSHQCVRLRRRGTVSVLFLAVSLAPQTQPVI